MAEILLSFSDNIPRKGETISIYCLGKVGRFQVVGVSLEEDGIKLELTRIEEHEDSDA